MDALSNIVSLLEPHDCVAAGLDAGGDWSIEFEKHAGLKCNAILKGDCWLSVEGVANPVHLDSGDCMILPTGRPFRISRSQARFGANTTDIYEPVTHGGTAVFGGGGEFFMTGSRFLLSGPAADTLLQTLPPIIIVRQGSEQEAVRWSLSRISEELQTPRPGSALSIAHLSHFVLVQVLRCYLQDSTAELNGWLAAIADPYISKAITAIHENLARPWTVQELGSLSGLGRTAFAVRFRNITGQTPIGYLTQLRMFFAAKRLLRPGTSIAQLAEEVGYGSESAFSVAFKRETGQCPGRYARSRVRNQADLARYPSKG